MRALVVLVAGCHAAGAGASPTPVPVAVPAPPAQAPAAMANTPTTPTQTVPFRPTQVPWPDSRRRAAFAALGGGTQRSVAVAVSADGSTVVGFAIPSSGRDTAVRWRAGTLEPLTSLDLPGDDRSIAYAVSRNGSVIVGESSATETSSRPVVWRHGTGVTALTLPAGVESCAARTVSEDGKTIAGIGYGRCSDGGECQLAVRWRNTRPAIVAIDNQPLHLSSVALSADGRVLAGTLGEAEVVRIRGDQLVRIDSQASAEAMSSNGKVIVGNVDGRAATRWVGLKPNDLGALAGYDSCWARAVSADGNRVIGNCTRPAPAVKVGETPRADPQGSIAFVWDRGRGMRSILDALGAETPDGWWLDEAFGISGDGKTIVGNGQSPSSAEEAWLVIIPR